MRIIYTAGVFDLFHAGHLEIIERSKGLGDYLIVGVVSDAGTEAYKRRRPKFTQTERMALVRANRFVDEVYLQPTTDPTPVLCELASEGRTPDIMTHGDDWDELLEGNETLDRLGIGFVLIPRTTGRYTSSLIQEIQQEAAR